MRLEVQYPDGEKEILEFKKKVVNIGRGSENDLQLSIEGVSRKHLKIEEIKNQFFITDVGSSNGTLLNDEKITPHRPVEFSTFFPVVFGVGISIRLLNEDDGVKAVNATPASARKGAQNTASLTRSLLAENTTVDPTKAESEQRDITNPEILLSAKMKNKRKSKNNKNQSYITIFLLICGAYYFFFIRGSEDVKEDTQVQTSRELPRLSNKPVVKPVVQAAIELKPEEILNKEKCLSELEKKYCTILGLKDYYEGLVVKDKRIYLILNYPEQVKSFLFLNPLSDLDNQHLATRIEAQRSSQNTQTKEGETVNASEESRLAQGAFVSLLLNQDFYNTLSVEQNLDEVFLISFKRVEGIPRITYTETIKLTKLLELGKRQLMLPIQILFGGGFTKEYNEVTLGLVQAIK